MSHRAIQQSRKKASMLTRLASRLLQLITKLRELLHYLYLYANLLVSDYAVDIELATLSVEFFVRLHFYCWWMFVELFYANKGRKFPLKTQLFIMTCQLTQQFRRHTSISQAQASSVLVAVVCTSRKVKVLYNFPNPHTPFKSTNSTHFNAHTHTHMGEKPLALLPSSIRPREGELEAKLHIIKTFYNINWSLPASAFSQ